MDREDVDIIERKTAFQGYFRIDEYRLRYALFAGGHSEVATRELLERGHVGAVLPLDPDRDAVVLIEQFRIGAHAAGLEPWLVECVAGIIEPGEDSRGVAIREAREEAGCEILDLFEIQRYLATPGASSETIDLYCGRVDSRGLGGIHGLASEGEDIRVTVQPVETALDWVRSGRIVNAMTIIALQWLALNYPEVKRRWAPS